MLAVVPTDDNVFIPAFGDFWCLYPKRVCRKDAERAWQRLTANERIEATIALSKWRGVWLARGDMQYVPNASTWLNGERWTDELPATNQPSHASHVLRDASSADVPKVIPEDVKALIARMKTK